MSRNCYIPNCAEVYSVTKKLNKVETIINASLFKLNGLKCVILHFIWNL